MVEIGRMNELEIVREAEFGLYLDGGEDFDEILLPNRYVPEKFKAGDLLEVFVYKDSEDRLVATTERPLAMVGDFAHLKVVAVNAVGAFLDWGLPKDLLLPFNEQKQRVETGDSCLVRIFLDVSTQRVVASTKLKRFLNQVPPRYRPGEEVSLLITAKTDLGYSAIINNTHWGLIFESEVFEHLKTGSRRTGYIKSVREDGKIDLSLQKTGYEQVMDISEEILSMLEAQGGFLPLTDDASPATIRRLFGVSKRAYKKALGALYRKQLIDLEPKGIRLIYRR